MHRAPIRRMGPPYWGNLARSSELITVSAATGNLHPVPTQSEPVTDPRSSLQVPQMFGDQKTDCPKRASLNISKR
jgi:hypothetical protein